MSSQTVSPLKLVGTALYLLVWPALLFVLAGDWRWIEGWLFGAWFVALCSTCIVWLYRKDPALLAERYRKPGTGGQQAWDTFVVYALVLGFVAWIVVMPLDAKRFGWSSRFLWWCYSARAFGPACGWLEACGGAMLASS